MPASSPRRAAATLAQLAPAIDVASERWTELFGTPPPRSPSLLAQAIAWQEQVAASGDISAAVKRDLAIVAAQIREARGEGEGPLTDTDMSFDPSSLPPASSQLVPGTRLVKAYGGKTHVVEVTDSGMIYNGATYASLSAVAKVITGTHWNGLLFFGLRKRRVYPAKVAANG